MIMKPTSPETPAAQNNPSAGVRRIRRISQYLRGIVLIYLVVLPGWATVCILASHRGDSAGWYWGPSGAGVSLVERWLAALSGMIYLGMAVIFYRLLNLVERGTYFAVANVRLLRWLGNLAFANGLLGAVAPVVVSGMVTFPTILLAPFFSPMVIGGLVIIMFSHIMEEACKLREEQALTV
jgi:hypothetical protein